jgi:prepilin-type N-terminal cleavage/methylation domain-containing protein
VPIRGAIAGESRQLSAVSCQLWAREAGLERTRGAGLYPVRLAQAASLRARPWRRGMSLIEVMVVIAILLAVAVITVPAIGAYLQLEQHRAAKELALTYELLHDEAVLRNVTFRIAYHLDEGKWKVEVGRPETLIFADPQARQDYEDELADKMKLLTEREKAEGEGGTDEESEFQALQEMWSTERVLPRGSRFRRFYSPQYGGWVEPTEDSGQLRREDDPPLVVYSYIFPSGFSEPTVVQIVESDDPEEGYTVEVEPLTGTARIHPELVSYEEMLSDLPDTPPELP